MPAQAISVKYKKSSCITNNCANQPNCNPQMVPAQGLPSLMSFWGCSPSFQLPITPVPVDIKHSHQLKGKVVLVTGGSRGIGHATCQAFVDLGCMVIGTSRNPEIVKEFPQGAQLYKLDVRSDESVASCIAQVIDQFGHIDILVNNAGVGQYGRLIKAKPDDWMNLFQTNLLGVHRVTTAAYPYMKGAESRIITLGSLEGEIGLPYQAIYAISKRALQMWNDLFDFEQRNENGPRFTLLEPAYVNTGFGTTPDIVDTEPDSQDPFVKLNKISFVKFLKYYGLKPSEVAKAIVGIATMDKPYLRYYVASQGKLIMGLSMEDLLTMVYTQPPETTMAVMEAFSALQYQMFKADL